MKRAPPRPPMRTPTARKQPAISKLTVGLQGVVSGNLMTTMTVPGVPRQGTTCMQVGATPLSPSLVVFGMVLTSTTIIESDIHQRENTSQQIAARGTVNQGVYG